MLEAGDRVREVTIASRDGDVIAINPHAVLVHWDGEPADDCELVRSDILEKLSDP